MRLHGWNISEPETLAEVNTKGSLNFEPGMAEAEREKRGDETTAIVRVEQLAPIPAKEIAEAIQEYPNAEIVWVQDEPKNQGAWPFMYFNLPDLLESHGETRRLRVVSRPASASPATGNSMRHAAQNAELMEQAFAR